MGPQQRTLCESAFRQNRRLEETLFFKRRLQGCPLLLVNDLQCCVAGLWRPLSNPARCGLREIPCGTQLLRRTTAFKQTPDHCAGHFGVPGESSANCLPKWPAETCVFHALRNPHPPRPKRRLAKFRWTVEQIQLPRVGGQSRSTLRGCWRRRGGGAKFSTDPAPTTSVQRGSVLLRELNLHKIDMTHQDARHSDALLVRRAVSPPHPCVFPFVFFFVPNHFAQTIS